MRLACVTRMTFLMAVAALLLHLVSGVVHPSRGQSSLKDDIASSSRGVPRPEAAIRVCTMPNTGQPCTPLAQIYSDSVLSQVLANPAATDGLGNYFGNVSSTGAINAFSFSLIGNLAAGAFVSGVHDSVTLRIAHHLVEEFAPVAQRDLCASQLPLDLSGYAP